MRPLVPSPILAIDAASADVGSYTYGYGHLMKPQRMRITHELVSAYGMLDKMHVLVSTTSHLPSHYLTDSTLGRSVQNARPQRL